MGHKVNPKIFRLGHTTYWSSKWFGLGSAYVVKTEQDIRIRKMIKNKLKDAGIDSVEIERSPDSLNIIIHSSKPGIIIGRGGAGVEELKNKIVKEIIKNKKVRINIDIKEVVKPQLSAMIVASNIAAELEKRIPYRRSMKRNIDAVMKAGAQGVKVICSGRLDGVEIARTETLYQGKLPLQTLRADIDYGRTAAHTTYGAVGIKVWIYKGEFFGHKLTTLSKNQTNSKSKSSKHYSDSNK